MYGIEDDVRVISGKGGVEAQKALEAVSGAESTTGAPAAAGSVGLGPVSTPSGAASPIDLSCSQRKLHVRDALKAFEKPVIEASPVEAARKLTKLKASPFIFFRGTADLFYQDLVGMDADKPLVLGYGDVHPENLGVLRAPDGELFYGLDDYDESWPAPFTWDLRRGAVGLELSMRESELGSVDRESVIDAFVAGYLDGLDDTKKHGERQRPRFTDSKSPGFIEKFIGRADKAKRKKHVDKYVDLDTARFDEPRLVSASDRVKEFNKALKPYRKSLPDEAPGKKRFFDVKDVAERLGSGTGSIGLKRFYVLIEGKKKKPTDDVILELKARRPSVVARHVSLPAHLQMNAADRVDRAVFAKWAQGDRFSGSARIDGVEYKVRERHPAHDRIDVSKLDVDELRDYAGVIGTLIADLHASGRVEGLGDKSKAKGIAKQLLSSFDSGDLGGAIREFAASGADRVESDHAAFVQLMDAGEIL